MEVLVRTRFVWSLTFLFIFSSAIFATEKTPTVDVISAEKLGDFWGMEFPTEGAESEAQMSSSLYVDKNGNPIIRFSYSGNHDAMYSLLYHIEKKKVAHFEKRILDLKKASPETKEKRYLRENGFIGVKFVPAKISHNDDDHALFYYPTPEYHWSSSIGGDICRPPIEGAIRVRDLQGKLIAEKTLLYSSSKKRGHHSAPGCVSEGNGSGRPRKLSTISLHLFRIWQVDDGTVLAEVSNAPYVIRLTPQLLSPFVEQHPDLRFFEPGLLKPLYDQLFEQHWRHADKTDGKEDVYETIDEILFRYVQQYGKKGTTSSALPTP